MIKRILRTAVGIIFFCLFLFSLLIGALKFKLLSSTFWKTALNQSGIYSMLENNLIEFRLQLEGSVKKQTGGTSLSKELTALISSSKELTSDRFRELIETNIDRIFFYLNGQSVELILYLPVKEWNLPVKTLDKSVISKLTSQTPVAEALVILGTKPEQAKIILNGMEQTKKFVGQLVLIFVILSLSAVGILVGHYFFGTGLINRIKGTAWLVMISGLLAKTIGIAAGQIFDFLTSLSKTPLPPWGIEIGRSLIGQFFDFGSTIGLVVGIVGLGVFILSIYFAKQKKIKEEKISVIKKIISFSLGSLLGFILLALLIAALVFTFGRNFSPMGN